MGRLRKLTRPSKYEIYVSLLATLYGLWNAGTLPWNYQSDLKASGGFLVGLICAFNAMRDFKNMRWWERCVATVVFCFLICFTPLYLWGAATTTSYADR